MSHVRIPVLAQGLGFTALSPDTAVRSAHLRCLFGAADGEAVPALSHTDTQVVCTTPWGDEGDAQPVRVALNGASYRSRAGDAATSPLANLSQVAPNHIEPQPQPGNCPLTSQRVLLPLLTVVGVTPEAGAAIRVQGPAPARADRGLLFSRRHDPHHSLRLAADQPRRDEWNR